ncbi:MAG: TonB-dependent receptor plug domain-containing protein, partial [Bacteroidales bacterium]|nr:TonB-dependent receptor plug domain-containing protein [Bacteroidales bacterium]
MGQQQDTLISERLNEAVVQGVRADPAAPFAVTEVSKVQLSAFSRTGRELPFLLSRTPGVISWSENGMGTGTSYMRIRGADDSRINVTLDGIALNSPEDQCVFWANMNSYASMLGDIQIQRGIGTSTNGDGAFGGSVSLSSKSVNPYPFAEFTLGAGVYGTSRIGASFSSGLFEDHWVVEGAFNRTATDGYIHGTAGSSGSWYCGISWTDSRFQARYRLIGNYENTGQAWNGIEIDGMNSYDEIWAAGLGRYNSLVESYEIGEDGSVSFKPYTYDNGKTWKRTTDNFTQLHNILSFAYEPTDRLKTTLSLHYTYGYGWYDELKPNCKLSKFGLEPFTKSDGTTVKKTDLIRQKGLSQNTYGASWNAQYSTRNLNLIGGVSLQNFVGNHFGYLTHIGDPELSKKLLDGNF